MTPAGQLTNPLGPANHVTSALLIGAAGSLLIATSALAVASLDSRKLIAVVAGGLVFALAAALSGNARLLCLWMLMLSIPFNLSKYFGKMIMNGGEIAYRIEFSDVFLFLLVGFLALDLARGKRPGIRVPKVAIFGVLIVLRGSYEFLAGPWPDSAGHEVVRMIKMGLLFLVIVNEIETPKRLLHCSLALVSGLVVQSCVGLVQYYRGSSLGLEILGETNTRTIEILALTSIQDQKVWRVSALMLHPNLFGAYLAALLPMCLALFLLPLPRKAKIVLAGASALGMSALVATLSRSSWISFAAALSIFIFLTLAHRGIRQRAVVFTGTVLVVFLAILLFFQESITSRLFQSKNDATIGRELFKEDAKRMIAEKPWWGWGINSYTNEVAPFMKVSINAFEGKALPPVHHIYYLWWTETGIIGLLIHLALWATIVWAGIQNLHIRDKLMYSVNTACLCGLLAFAIDGFFSFTLRMNGPLKIFWVLSGMIIAIRYWGLRQTRFGNTVSIVSADAAPELHPAL